MKFTKKPVTIEAIQWTGNNLREVICFTDGPPDVRHSHAAMKWEEYCDLVARDGLKIFTLEGKMSATMGDWIIKGVKGEHYPCKPDIFEMTYGPAAPSSGESAEESDDWEKDAAKAGLIRNGLAVSGARLNAFYNGHRAGFARGQSAASAAPSGERYEQELHEILADMNKAVLHNPDEYSGQRAKLVEFIARLAAPAPTGESLNATGLAAFIDEYEWRTDEFCHTPTQQEREMLHDFAVMLHDAAPTGASK